jgi:hypothetical protein
MNNKKLFCLALIITCIASASLVKAQGTTIISIAPQTYAVAESDIGEAFTVDIRIDDVTNLWMWTISVNWDPEILNFSDVTEGSFLNSAGSTLFLWAPNWTAIEEGYIPEISCTLLSAEGVTGDGVLATLVFTSLSSGNSEITLTNTLLNQPESGHPEIAHSVVNGEVIVAVSSASPTPTPTSTPTSSPSSTTSPAPTSSPTSSPESGGYYGDGNESGNFFLIAVATVASAGIIIAAVILKKKPHKVSTTNFSLLFL